MKTILSVLFAGIICIAVEAQPPKLNSNPNASAVIYLDFDGQLVQGTSWNWSGSIVAQGSGLSSAAITEIFNRVAEDYRIFNLNITTDSSLYEAASVFQRNRIIITPTYQWYGSAGGVAYVGSFSWGDDTPAWVFSGLLNNNIKYIAEAISHEAGHTLGLQHQSNYDPNCIKTAEYCPGQGSGEISWAPIMGVGYYKNSTTWHNGPNAYGCTYLQNDIEIIAGSPNNIGLRVDDHGDNHQSSTPIIISANSFQANGIINTFADKDVFAIYVTANNNFKLNVIPLNVGANNAGANIDIRVTLLNAMGDTINRYNPTDLLNVVIDTNLTSANYFLVVEGTGNSNLLDYGSLGFYSLVGSIAGVLLPIDKVELTGKNENGIHQLKWNYQTGENSKQLEIESSSDAIYFSRIAVVTSNTKSYSLKPLTNQVNWYRVKVITEEGKAVYSNVLRILTATKNSVFVKNIVVTNEIELTSYLDAYNYQLLDQKGSLLRQGKCISGVNRLSSASLPSGLLLLKVFNQSGTYLFKLIKQ